LKCGVLLERSKAVTSVVTPVAVYRTVLASGLPAPPRFGVFVDSGQPSILNLAAAHIKRFNPPISISMASRSASLAAQNDGVCQPRRRKVRSLLAIPRSLTSPVQRHQSASKATRRSERILAQTITEQQPQYSMKQEACLRYLSPLSMI